MKNYQNLNMPIKYEVLLNKSKEIGFTMATDPKAGSLLRTLTASKPNGNFLELGTGVGLSLVWMLDGMDKNAKVTSIDSDAELIRIAKSYFDDDSRIELVCGDAGKWLNTYNDEPFDLIFADAWPGKYSHLDRALGLLNKGGFYVIDDMERQPNWPEGHEEKAVALAVHLNERDDIKITNMDWSTGLMIAVKTK